MYCELKSTTIGIRFESGHVIGYSWEYYIPVKSERWLLFYY
jgi:hypothetical protein